MVKQLLQLFLVRPSLSLSVSTAPASALLCDRLTPACPWEDHLPKEDPAVSLARTSWHHLQENADCPHGALRPVDSWPPPPFLLQVRLQAPKHPRDKGAGDLWMATPDPPWEAESEV